MEEVQAIDTWESSSRTSGVTHETNGHPEAVLLLPPLVSLICFVKYRAYVSPRAEVDLVLQLTLGPGVRISSFTKIKISGPLIIGSNAQIATGCIIGAGPKGLEIGEDTLIGSNCTAALGLA
ncbi:MAG: hypothetical protein ACRED0_07310 [Gammaproteobacteria bacterium]